MGYPRARARNRGCAAVYVYGVEIRNLGGGRGAWVRRLCLLEAWEDWAAMDAPICRCVEPFAYIAAPQLQSIDACLRLHGTETSRRALPEGHSHDAVG